jgi:hypothetical protein
MRNRFAGPMKRPGLSSRRFDMKKEDLWMIGVVAFSILWTMAFGWGLFG